MPEENAQKVKIKPIFQRNAPHFPVQCRNLMTPEMTHNYGEYESLCLLEEKAQLNLDLKPMTAFPHAGCNLI